MNARSNGRLRNLLTGRGLRPVDVVGAAPDGSWSEESFAVASLSPEKICALGRDFGQSAVFELTPTALRVLRCPDAKVMPTAGAIDQRRGLVRKLVVTEVLESSRSSG